MHHYTPLKVSEIMKMDKEDLGVKQSWRSFQHYRAEEINSPADSP
jgi:hypothetical protein